MMAAAKPYSKAVWTMNRRKKIKQLLQAHQKKASAKLAPRKPRYICKADRLKLETEGVEAAPPQAD
jgi:hypothetical protein